MEIPEPTKRRLVLLEHVLSSYSEKNITSQKIQELTGWNSALIRRDFLLLDIKRGASNGYKVDELRVALEKLLQLHANQKKCCIIGLGGMGQSLLYSTEIENSSFKLVAGFDSSVNRTEVLSSRFPLHPTTLLEKVIKEEDIHYAILTVENAEAQPIARRLAQCGIKGIVNYTPCVLTVPKTVKVENISLLTSLENLSAGCSDSL